MYLLCVDSFRHNCVGELWKWASKVLQNSADFLQFVLKDLLDLSLADSVSVEKDPGRSGAVVLLVAVQGLHKEHGNLVAHLGVWGVLGGGREVLGELLVVRGHQGSKGLALVGRVVVSVKSDHHESTFDGDLDNPGHSSQFGNHLQGDFRDHAAQSVRLHCEKKD